MTTKYTLPNPLNTAVLFLVFNRPDTTARVFEAIRQAKPPCLYVAADGPREGREDEAERVAKVREIATAVDWPCEVKTLFREKNLGCKHAVSSAITWFFEQEEQGIILEDDCLPHPDFFSFCEILLDYYSKDERVSMITGDNFLDNTRRGDASYYFSIHNHCWGWASWRRSWNYYDSNVPFWLEWRGSKTWKKKFPDKIERRYWEKIIDAVYANKVDSWAYPWGASIWYHGGLTATPNVNLVSNIGFGSESTHTADPDDPLSNMDTSGLSDIVHPIQVTQDMAADRYVFDHAIGGLQQRGYRRLAKLPHCVAGKLYRILKSSLGTS